MSDLRLSTHAEAEVPDLVPGLTDLLNIAFAEYEGAMLMTVDFMRWYVQRPVMPPTLCQVAVDGDSIVSNVFSTVQTLHFLGKPLRCGIIDSVCTLPEYRGRGIARHLMERTHEAMVEAGLDMAVLYTNPDGHPYAFYQRMGYKTRSWADLLTGPRPDPAGAIRVRPALEPDHPAVRALIGSAGRIYDGMPELDDAYWRWHKTHRPTGSPVTVLIALAGATGKVLGTATFCDTDLALGGDAVKVSFLADLFLADDAPEDTGSALLAAAPQDTIGALCDMCDPMYNLFISHMFQRQVCEVSMLLPLSKVAREIAASEPAPWYVMVESVVGV